MSFVMGPEWNQTKSDMRGTNVFVALSFVSGTRIQYNAKKVDTISLQNQTLWQEISVLLICGLKKIELFCSPAQGDPKGDSKMFRR